MQNDPLVSILIPTFQRPVELRRALESVVAQTYGNLEIIVSNNDCTDAETSALCREFAAKDRRVVHHEQPVNIGGWENHRFLIQAATGKYTLAMNDDDWIGGNYIEATLQILHKTTNCLRHLSPIPFPSSDPTIP